MRNIIVTLTLCTLLSGCAPCAVLSGAAAGSVFSDKRDFKTQWHDKTTTHKIAYWVTSTPELKHNTHINVTTVNGVVLLAGQVPTEAIGQAIYQHAKTVSGVKRVYNRMEIAAPTSLTRQARDAWLTTKIKTAMIDKAGMSSAAIKVVSEDGIVYLLGIVGRDEGNQAANITRHVPGVSKVVKLFEYT